MSDGRWTIFTHGDLPPLPRQRVPEPDADRPFPGGMVVRIAALGARG